MVNMPCRVKETSNEEVTTNCHVPGFKYNKAFLTHTRVSRIKIYISCSYGFFLNYAISVKLFYLGHIQPQITPCTELYFEYLQNSESRYCEFWDVNQDGGSKHQIKEEKSPRSDKMPRPKRAVSIS